MSIKLIRFIASLAVIAGIAGNSGVVSADRGARPSVSAQNLKPGRAAQPQPVDITALNIPAASSLGVQFVHIATAANTAWDVTTIDHPLANGNPNAIIIVTPNYNPGGVGGTYHNHPIGVKYAGGRWLIYNQDGLQIPAGAAFNVIIPTAGAFVHTSTVAGNDTAIDNALTNGHPNAIVFVTPNYTPNGTCGCVNNNHNIGVFYSGGKWRIFNQDYTNVLPVGAAFNVFVPTVGAGIFVHTATAGNINGSSTEIDNALTNDHPNAIVFATQNYNPGFGLNGTDNNHPTGVNYDSATNKWAIFNQDGAAPAVDAAFNVLVLVPRSDFFVHSATVGIAPYTIMDNALTNGQANAIVFTTPNWNPGGFGGAGHNHNTGMYYNGNQWAIINQDSVNISVGVAFNVLVPNPDTSVFVHTATAANILSHSTILDYPLTNGSPNAIIIVTLNWKAGGVCGCVYDDHPIGVFYDGSKWRIYNEDGAAMPVGAAFNVFVPPAGVGVGVFVHKFSGLSWPDTLIDNPLTNGNPSALILVTPNYNPGGVGGLNADYPIGVRYYSTDKKWGIFSQDGTAMTDTTAFNVYVFANHKAYLPLVRR
jgi:hypothetical protein